jgi:hypothetical protein
MAALNLGSSPITEPQSKSDRVLHAAETALSVATEILTVVGKFTENVPYVNAVTGAISKLIGVKKVCFTPTFTPRILTMPARSGGRRQQRACQRTCTHDLGYIHICRASVARPVKEQRLQCADVFGG